jgi:hypothetical protein
VAAYRRAIELEPGHREARVNLGVTLLELGDVDGAVEVQRQALALDPGLAEAHNNLAAALLAQSRPEEALAALRAALAADPDAPLPHANWGVVHNRRGDLAEAAEGFRRAVALRPQVASLHLNLALTLLQATRFADGWREYEWRWRNGGAPATKPGTAQPLWDGSPLAGRRILLMAEQGLGDIVHFLRYAAAVKDRGGTVIAEVRPPLARLAASCPGVDEVALADRPPPAFDVQIPLLSLPRIFATDLSSIPADVPYLAAPGPPRPEVREALAGARGDLKVGLVWAGNPSHPGDRQRSCPVDELAPLARVGGVALFGLQHGPRAADLERLPAGSVTDLSAWLGDLAHTAAILGELDLLVTVDTSAAHLAGALARPAWVLLSTAPDWRWLRDGEKTPWYPTLRLYRQRSPGDWGELAERVAAELAELAGGLSRRRRGGRRAG